MKVSFLKHAQFELDDSVEWYNNQFPGLGKEFLDEIIVTVAVAHLHREPGYWYNR